MLPAGVLVGGRQRLPRHRPAGPRLWRRGTHALGPAAGVHGDQRRAALLPGELSGFRLATYLSQCRAAMKAVIASEAAPAGPSLQAHSTSTKRSGLLPPLQVSLLHARDPWDSCLTHPSAIPFPPRSQPRPRPSPPSTHRPSPTTRWAAPPVNAACDVAAELCVARLELHIRTGDRLDVFDTRRAGTRVSQVVGILWNGKVDYRTW
jgi:hypothetical protein